jgi:DNA-binding GntR family transcriptional regulator
MQTMIHLIIDEMQDLNDGTGAMALDPERHEVQKKVSARLRPVIPSIRVQVRDQLRDAILSGHLKPGDRILEAELARQFGVSITPIREALRELASARLVVSQPHRGTVVQELSPQDIREMYTLRAHLERLAVQLALPLLTEEDFDHLQRLIDEMVALAHQGRPKEMASVDVAFHEYICLRSGHRLLHQTWAGINPANWTMLSVHRLAVRGPLYIAERHRPLLDVLRTKDSARAEEAIATHILEVVEQILAEWPASQKESRD